MRECLRAATTRITAAAAFDRLIACMSEHEREKYYELKTNLRKVGACDNTGDGGMAPGSESPTARERLATGTPEVLSLKASYGSRIARLEEWLIQHNTFPVYLTGCLDLQARLLRNGLPIDLP